MLTNLEFLNPGEHFPPESEKQRLLMYAENRALFEGKHANLYREDLKRIERVIGNFENVVSYPVILNFQKLMSLKIADLLLGEPPKVYVEDEKSAEQDSIDEIMGDGDLINTAYQVAIDVSRYGDGIFEIYVKDGKNRVGIIPPSIWFPVVNPLNIQDVLYHVLAWETNDNRLFVKIHSHGVVEEREYSIDHGVIVREIAGRKVSSTGLDGNSIIQVSNIKTSDRAVGIDDYTDLDSIISDLMVRIGQIDRILDKHANPSMSGPASALEQDPVTGMWRLKTANYFPRDRAEDPDISYITWDGQLNAAFMQIEKLVNMLYTLSEMGSALFGESSGNTGQVLTASALRIKMMTPLGKVNRIRMRFDPALKQAIALCSQFGYKAIKKEDISIQWFDGLPTSTKEDSEVISSRTGNKATMSQLRALQIFDGMTKEKAEEELERIREDEEFDAPMKSPPFAEADEDKDNTEVITND